MPMTAGNLSASLSGPLLDFGREHQVQHHQAHRGTEFFEAELGPDLRPRSNTQGAASSIWVFQLVFGGQRRA
jgi:hypothetical protein